MAAEGEYRFTVDWFSHNAPVWDRLVDEMKPRRILEIGSFEGKSAVYMIERCAPFGPIEICCVDTWEGGIEHDKTTMSFVEERFDWNVKLASERATNAVTLRKMKSTSSVALARLVADPNEGRVDFAYIDGSHQAPDVLADAVLAFQLVRVGGALVFDDYLWTKDPDGRQDILNMPKIAIDAFVNIYQRKLRLMYKAPLCQIYALKLSD